MASVLIAGVYVSLVFALLTLRIFKLHRISDFLSPASGLTDSSAFIYYLKKAKNKSIILIMESYLSHMLKSRLYQHPPLLSVLVSGTAAVRSLQQTLSLFSTTVSCLTRTRQTWEWLDTPWGASLRAAGRSSTLIKTNRRLWSSPDDGALCCWCCHRSSRTLSITAKTVWRVFQPCVFSHV